MIVNVMEQHVKEAYQRLKATTPEFVDSPEHRDDVVVYALNRLPPMYVVTDEGMAVTEATLDLPQQRTAIDVKVLEGIRQVVRMPRTNSHRSGGK